MSTLALLATGTVTAAAGALAMYLPAHLRYTDARKFWAAGEREFDKAEQVRAEVERTRNLPWYWPTDPAAPEIEAAPADDHVTGEVLHVEHATGELPVLSDRPADDEDVVGDEQPGEAWFAGLVRALNRLRRIALVAVVVPPLFVWSWCVRWPIGKAQQAGTAWRRRRAERHMVGSGEQATDVDPFAALLAAEPEPEPVTIVRVNHRYRKPGDTGLFPLVKVVGDKRAGRHRAEPEMPAINVPAQRTGDADE